MQDRLPSKLEKEPLLEAAWEIRFSSDQSASAELLTSAVLSHLRTNGDSVARLPVSEIPLQFREKQQELRFAPILQVVSDQYILAVGPRVVLLSCQRPYVGWKAFRQRIAEVMKVVAGADVVSTPERFSLKYFDVLAHQEEPNLDALKIRISMGQHVVTTEPTQLRLEIARNGFVHLISIAQPAEVKLLNAGRFRGVAVTVDSIRPWPADRPSLEFWQWIDEFLDAAHDENKWVFFSEILTPATVQAHRPIYT